jgi:hypothetical protein
MGVPKQVLLLFVAILVCFSFGFVLCQNQELSVLLEVKKSFEGDPEKVLHDWNESNPNSCTWTGVVGLLPLHVHPSKMSKVGSHHC